MRRERSAADDVTLMAVGSGWPDIVHAFPLFATSARSDSSDDDKSGVSTGTKINVAPSSLCS